MVFVTVGHDIKGPRGLAVQERQTIVYLDIPETFSPPKKRAMPTDAAAQTTFDVREPTLFRFSAITFNAHCIHYDLPYTQSVEKYPGLVIHGPLQAMQLMQLAQEHRGGPPSHFEFRGVHPMFLGCGQLDLAAVEDEDGGLALYAGQAGHQGTVARALWEGTV
jgi:3-methylfumaryl-CoA hydratase